MRLDPIDYTKIRTKVLKDFSLSWNAKGVFAYLSTMDQKRLDNFLEPIPNHGLSDKKLIAGIEELKNHGYLRG